MSWLPTRCQTTWGSPGRRSAPYENRARPSGAQRNSKTPGRPSNPRTREPLRTRPAARSRTNRFTAVRNRACCRSSRFPQSRRNDGVVSYVGTTVAVAEVEWCPGRRGTPPCYRTRSSDPVPPPRWTGRGRPATPRLIPTGPSHPCPRLLAHVATGPRGRRLTAALAPRQLGPHETCCLRRVPRVPYETSRWPGQRRPGWVLARVHARRRPPRTSP